MCFHIGKWWQIHKWCTLTLKMDTNTETHHQKLSPSPNDNWKIVIYLPICSQHSMFYHSRNLPPSSPLFKQFSIFGSKGDILVELNLFNTFKSHLLMDSFIIHWRTWLQKNTNHKNVFQVNINFKIIYWYNPWYIFIPHIRRVAIHELFIYFFLLSVVEERKMISDNNHQFRSQLSILSSNQTQIKKNITVLVNQLEAIFNQVRV